MKNEFFDLLIKNRIDTLCDAALREINTDPIKNNDIKFSTKRAILNVRRDGIEYINDLLNSDHINNLRYNDLKVKIDHYIKNTIDLIEKL